MNRKSRLTALLSLIVQSLLLVVFFLGASSQAAISKADWPMFQYNPAHTGYTTSTAPKETPSILWVRGDSYNTLTSPAVVDGVVYVSNHHLFALNESTGEDLWSVVNGGYTAPVVTDGIVYTGTSGGTAFNAITGEIIWSAKPESGTYADALTVADGYVYVGGSVDGIPAMIALNASTGKEIWNHIYTDPWSSPAVYEGYIYFGTSGGVRALDAFNGTWLWDYETEGPVYSSPAVAGGYVYVGSGDGNVYCLNASTGKKIWNYTTGNIIVHSSPAVAYGYVYIGSMDGNFYAFNALTGTKKWNYTTCKTHNYGVDSSPAVAKGVVYVGSDDGNLYAFNAYSGEKLWNYSVESEFSQYGGPRHMGASPAIANGKIYIQSNDYTLIALGPASASSPTPSPTPMVSPKNSPTPTITPSQEPQQTEQETIIGLAITVAVIIAGLNLLLYLKKRK